MAGKLTLQCLPYDLSVCKVGSMEDLDLSKEFFFLSRTDEEISLVCRSSDTPSRTVCREDGWKGFRIVGTLDFSLVGVLSRISGVLADEGISIFAVSTFNTDYILVRSVAFEKSLEVLSAKGYTIIR